MCSVDLQKELTRLVRIKLEPQKFSLEKHARLAGKSAAVLTANSAVHPGLLGDYRVHRYEFGGSSNGQIISGAY